jgi:hypothetical protein
MSNISSRLIKILLGLLMVITLVLVVIFYAGPVIDEGSNLEHPVITETYIYWAYILLGITAGITIIFSLYNMIINPKGAKKSLVALAGAAVLILVAYLLADDSVLNLPHYTGKDNVPETLKMVDTGLFTAYLLLGLAFVAIIYSEVSKAFK